MRRSKVLSCLLLIASLTTVVRGIFEDQVDEFDWKQENLGRVRAVAFGGGDKRQTGGLIVRGTLRAVYVASEHDARAVARIDSKTGEIKWRHILEADDAVDAIQLTNYGLLSLSGDAKNLRMWDINDGTLIWDNICYSGAPRHAVFGEIFAFGDDKALVLLNHRVVLVNLANGAISWTSELPSGIESIANAQIAADGSTLFVVGSKSASEQLLIKVSLAKGQLTSEMLQKSTYLLQRADENDQVVLVSLEKHAITLRGLESSAKETSISLPLADSPKEEIVVLDTQHKRSFVAVARSGRRLLCKITLHLKIHVVHSFPAEGLLVESLSHADSLFWISSKQPADRITIKAFSPLPDVNGIEWDAQIDRSLYGSDVARVFAGCSMRKKESKTPRCRAMLVMRDDALVMTTNDDSAEVSPEAGSSSVASGVSWIREESLARVKSMHWITPAETEIETQSIKHIPSFTEELSLEVQRAKQLARHALDYASSMLDMEKNNDVNRLESRRARKEPANAHFFGFSKYIVMLTESGKLFAMRAESRQVVWSRFVGPQSTLLVTRDHPALGAGAELLLLKQDGSVVRLDGENGKVIVTHGNNEAPSNDSWMVLLPKRRHHIDDADETISLRRTVALVNGKTNDVTLVPPPADAKERASYMKELHNFYFYRFVEDAHAFRGFVLKESQDKATDKLLASQVWSVVLPAEEKLVASCHQSRKTVVDSAVTITGDDSLLLKYLNPHMFGFATLSQETSEEGEQWNVLHVSLVDGITGRLIHRVRHLHGAEPVQMVQSENWVVYSYWNTKEKRTEMISLSLFDGAVGSHQLNLWKRPHWQDTRSSYESKLPIVLQKAYIFPARIQSLGVTMTSRGITPQFVLVGMENGQIFKLARNFIDPRQPETPPTPEQQAEGLFPYSPLVPVFSNPHAMITYNKTIGLLHHIETCAAELESTTLVFAYGLDLFYNRLAPAKSFDLLPSDFNYELLVLLCIGFIVATLGSRSLSNKKELGQAWK